MTKNLKQVKQYGKGVPALYSLDFLATGLMSAETRPRRTNVPVCAMNMRIGARKRSEDITSTMPRKTKHLLVDLLDPVWRHCLNIIGRICDDHLSENQACNLKDQLCLSH